MSQVSCSEVAPMLPVRVADRRRPDTAARLCTIAADAAAEAFGVSTKELRMARRGSASVAFARQTAMYLGHTVYGLSFTAVGRAFHRDRTTAAHACRLVEDRRDDPGIDAIIGRLEMCCGHAGVDKTEARS